jgi:hypothetical protein
LLHGVEQGLVGPGIALLVAGAEAGDEKGWSNSEDMGSKKSAPWRKPCIVAEPGFGGQWAGFDLVLTRACLKNGRSKWKCEKSST